MLSEFEIEVFENRVRELEVRMSQLMNPRDMIKSTYLGSVGDVIREISRNVNLLKEYSSIDEVTANLTFKDLSLLEETFTLLVKHIQNQYFINEVSYENSM